MIKEISIVTIKPCVASLYASCLPRLGYKCRMNKDSQHEAPHLKL